MPTARDLPTGHVEQLRNAPIHPVLIELSQAARDARILLAPEFKKLVAYLLEIADGRDRREPWTQTPGVARPVPKLRVAIDKCFGVYGDLHWFKLNRTTNSSGQPLTGLFPRIAASLWRVNSPDFAAIITALLSNTPDAGLLRMLQDRSGRIKGMGVEVFSRLAFAYRRDLYFVIPKPWGETSGCLEYIGDDLRRYCGLCRNLRAVCDEIGIPADIRASVFNELLSQKKPPAPLLEALHKSIGPSLARYSAMDAALAFDPKNKDEDPAALPLEFANNAIKARRGRKDLRDALLRACGDRCALTGTCLRDLLEVAYVVPFPTGDVHAADNTILLRSDLHTLWDLNMIGVEPTTLRVHLAPNLSGTTYEKLAGRTLLPRLDGTQVTEGALKERWRLFSNAHPKVTSAETPLPRQVVQRHRAEPERPQPTDRREPPEVTVTRRETEQSGSEQG